MQNSLNDDLQRLGSLAFHRREWGEDGIRRYHATRRKKGDAAVKRLDGLYLWMFVPTTLWPFNIQHVFEWCLSRISDGKPLGDELRLLLEVLPPPPSGEACAVIAGHEHEVQQGHYEELVTNRAKVKFDAEERALALDPALKREWNRIKALWDVDRFRDYKGVIRRTFTGERNFRPLSVNWNKRAERFQVVFDAFCLRWNLYGVQADKPLLMKLTANVTPHGTMIFIPAYWWFDAGRDVRWKAVMKPHRAHSAKKQGAALAEGIEQRHDQAMKLRELDRESTRLHLRGQKRHAYLCKGLGLVEETDPKRLARLRREFQV